MLLNGLTTGCCMCISVEMEVCDSGLCNWLAYISKGKEFPANMKTQTISVLGISIHNETYLQEDSFTHGFQLCHYLIVRELGSIT